MNKHSRAPFTIDDRYEEPNVVGADGFIVAELPSIATSPSWFVSNPDKHWAGDPASHIERPIEELEANAGLFRAAPALLTVCKKARDLYDHLSLGPLEAAAKYGPDYEPPTDEDMLAVRGELEAAIALAAFPTPTSEGK